MKVVFVSNYYNHHQKYLARAFENLTSHNYFFIETQKISEERLKMGWGMENIPVYVLQNYIDSGVYTRCQKIIDDADVVIIGSAPHKLIRHRLKEKKLTFCYSERLYKKGYQYYKMPIRMIRHYLKYTRYKNLYMLCASAYTAADFAKTGTFLNKTYKWGYFTEVKRYDDVNQLIELKHPTSILWVARFIEWKHPEVPIFVAKRLKAEGYVFTLNMIGNGEFQEQIAKQITEYGLEDSVHLLGSMKPEQVREHMEQSEIFLFTSDRNEGWGAVLNEAMNSACAVVASHAIGAVPFLLEDKKNGLIYKDGDFDDLYRKVKHLLDHPNERIEMANNAYMKMIDEWNAENAVRKFIELSERILSGTKNPSLCAEGVCSRAERLRDDWKK